MKPESCAKYNVDSNGKDPKFKVGDHVGILKYKKMFGKGHSLNLCEVLVISKIKTTVPWTYVISDKNDEKFVGYSYEKNCRRLMNKTLEYKKSLKEKEINYTSNIKVIIVKLKKKHCIK